MSIIPGTPKSTLTVRELDGTPSGSATELVLPNGSLSFSGSVATIDLVGNADSRLGVVYDPTNEDAALACNNQLWTFLDGTTRDNLRTELQAAAASHLHGNITNSGTIGTTADLILGTGTAGAIETRTASQVRTLLGLATTSTPQFAGIDHGSSNFDIINSLNRNLRFANGNITPLSNGNSNLGSNANAFAQVATRVLLSDTNLIEQRNGTNGQIARWAKTWTSATNNEVFELDCAGNATTFDLAVCSGSAGGSNRGLRFGSKFAGGAFSPWLSFDTSGNVTLGSTAPSFFSSTARLSMVANSSRGIYVEGNSASIGLFANFSGVSRSGANAGVSIDNASSPIPFFVGRSSAAVILIELSGNGDFTFTPSSSRTLSTNGQFSIERVSNTEVNLVYRGDDGVTRRLSMSGFA